MVSSEPTVVRSKHVEPSPRSHTEWQQRAAVLGHLIERYADDIEQTQRFPEPLLTGLHEEGLLRMLLPRCYGGGEVPPSDYLLAIEELARHDGSVGWNAFVANSAALIAPFLSAQSARAIFDGPTVIAWGPPNACEAHAVPGGYQVSGRWPFASGCRQASWMGVHCRVRAGADYRRNAAGTPIIRTLLFPAENARLLDDWDPIGLRGTASGSYELHDVFVEEAFSATREEPERRQIEGPLYAFTMQGLYAVGVAGVMLGIAGAMLEALLTLSKE